MMTPLNKDWNFRFLVFGFVVLMIMVLRVIDIPLVGTHRTRQADTLFTGYSYCIGDSTFFFPKVVHRESTEGIAIGEFPLFSALISIPCRLTGEWSEVYPKLLTYLLWFLDLIIWCAWFIKKRFRRKGEIPLSYKSYLGFIAFFGFSPLLLTYLLIPIPDVLAIGIIGIAAHSWLKKEWKFQIIGALLFGLGFVMRPYFFPLLIVLAPSWIIGIGTFGICGILYLLWFKFWIRHTQIWYYLTDTKSMMSLFEAGWSVPFNLIQQILLNHLNYIGLWPFILGLKSNRRLLGAWIFSILFVILLKSDHFVNHAYYLMATGIISVLAMAEGYFLLNSHRIQKWIIPLFVVMGLLAVQHHWRLPRDNRRDTLPALMLDNKVTFKDRIAVYDGFTPQTLYLAKKVGWLKEKSDWKGPQSCPEGAAWALFFDINDLPSLIACQK